MFLKKFIFVIVMLVLLFNPVNATPVSWWDLEWDSRYAINNWEITTDMNKTNMIKIAHVDFSLLNLSCANANDFRVASETTEVYDLNLQGWDGTNTDNDVNVLFRPISGISSATYDGLYYFYTNNDGCPAPTNYTIRQNSFDGFENNNYISEPTWKVSLEGSETIEIQGTVKKNGSYALRMTHVSDSPIVYYNADVNLGSVSTFFRTTELTYGGFFYVLNSSYSGGDWSSYQIIGGYTSADNWCFEYGGGSDCTSISVDTWYYIVFNNFTNNTADGYIYASDTTTLINSKMNMNFRNSGVPQTIGLSARGSSADGSVYFDDVTFDKAYTFPFSLGSEEEKPTWWDYDYGNRIALELTNTSENNLTDFWVDFNSFNANTLLGEGKIQADFDDVRVVIDFVDTNRFIRENLKGTDTTHILFPVSVSANSSKTVYIYYGNEGASAPTFATETASWTNTDVTGFTASETNGVINITGTKSGNGWYNYVRRTGATINENYVKAFWDVQITAVNKQDPAHCGLLIYRNDSAVVQLGNFFYSGAEGDTFNIWDRSNGADTTFKNIAWGDIPSSTWFSNYAIVDFTNLELTADLNYGSDGYYDLNLKADLSTGGYTVGFGGMEYADGGTINCNIKNVAINYVDADLFYTTGEEEVPEIATAPDMNILTIEGIDDDLEILLSYDGNGLIPIEFEVFDPNAEDLTADIYYDTTQGGISNVIIEDLNLSSANCITDMNGSSKNVCSYDWNISGLSSDDYYIRVVVTDTGDLNSTDDSEYAGGITIDNTDPTISDIIINDGDNLEGINFDLDVSVSDTSGVGVVSYKCYTSTPASCVSESWDCHLGNMDNVGGNNYSVEVTGNEKDTAGAWICQITAEDVLKNQSQDTNTATMNDILSMSVDATSGTYGAINLNSTENPISTNLSNPYFVITHGGNVNLNIIGNCGDLNSGIYGIDKANHKWYDSDIYGSSTPCTGTNQTMKSDWARGTYPSSPIQNQYYWLDVPLETTIANNYTGEIAITSIKS